MDPLTINFEWRIPVENNDGTQTELTSLVSRLTQEQVDSYLSRYTPGQPVDPADAAEYFTQFMATLAAAQN